MMTSLIYAATGAALGLGLLLMIVLVLRAREDSSRAALRGDFIQNPGQSRGFQPTRHIEERNA